MEIRQIKKQSAADLVCERIKDNIITGRWSIGQKLPSETELSQIYGVNRSTVRAALQTLNVLGLIETRVGEGSFVKQLNFAEYLSDISDIYLSEVQEKNLMEYRRIIETESAILAMERATKEDIQELKLRCQRYMDESIAIWPLIEKDDPSVEERYMLVCRHDLDFHEQIVIMAHNEFLQYAFSLIKNSVTLHILVLSLRRISKVKGGDITPFMETTSSHQRMLDAIIAKDQVAFRKAYNIVVDNEY